MIPFFIKKIQSECVWFVMMKTEISQNIAPDDSNYKLYKLFIILW